MGETDMKIEKVTGIYFSPTGHTREVVQHIAEGLDNSAELLDLTSAEHETQRRQYSAQELVVVGVPVYGGRIPALAEKRMTLMQGDQTPAVIVVTYGNRDYEDALLELKNELEHRRFVVVGAAAVVTEHSIVHEVGAGRPDEQDWQQINHFVEELNKKLQQLDNVNQQERVKVKGKYPYRKYDGIPLKPKADKHCTSCGFCVRECPAQAIDAQHPQKTDKSRCISCMRCVTYCPQEARHVNPLLLKLVSAKMKKSCSARRENEFSF